jgi:hypothetical protein
MLLKNFPKLKVTAPEEIIAAQFARDVLIALNNQSKQRIGGIVIARSEATRRSKSHKAPNVPPDCFALLAMTTMVRPKCNLL